MGKLFKIEMKKLWKSTAMRVMLLVTLVLSIISVAMYVMIDNMAEDMSMGPAVSGYSILTTIFQDSSDSMLFTVLLIAILIGGDFSARTLQTQIAAGFSRFKVIMSRYLSTIVAFLIFYFATMLFMVGGVSMFIGFGREMTGELFVDILLKTFMSVFMGASTLSIYMFFCFLVKSTGASIGICLPFMLLGAPILTTLSYVFETCEFIIGLTPFGQVLLIPAEFDGMGYFKFYAVGLVWLVGMIYLTYLTFRRAELK